MNNNLENLQISEIELLNESLKNNIFQPSKTKTPSKIKSSITITIVAIVSLVLLLIINFTLNVHQSYISIAASSKVLAVVYISIYFIAIFGILFYILNAIKSYMNLKDAFKIQNQTANIESYDQEKEIALIILKHYQFHQSDSIRDKAISLALKIETNSVHSPFLAIKNEIINDLDKEAVNTLYISAKEVSLFTAFSPGSALDSIAVIFSSVKLMKKIFHIYGYKTNIFTSLLIARKILENASLAALMEYTDDTLSDVLGNTFLSKISVKIAQGLGNGVLMLRVGNMIIQSARPFASDGSLGTYKHMVKLFMEYIKEKIGKKSE